MFITFTLDVNFVSIPKPVILKKLVCLKKSCEVLKMMWFSIMWLIRLSKFMQWSFELMRLLRF